MPVVSIDIANMLQMLLNVEASMIDGIRGGLVDPTDTIQIGAAGLEIIDAELSIHSYTGTASVVVLSGSTFTVNKGGSATFHGNTTLSSDGGHELDGTLFCRDVGRVVPRTDWTASTASPRTITIIDGSVFCVALTQTQAWDLAPDDAVDGDVIDIDIISGGETHQLAVTYWRATPPAIGSLSVSITKSGRFRFKGATYPTIGRWYVMGGAE
jgi:hypothetical protein